MTTKTIQSDDTAIVYLATAPNGKKYVGITSKTLDHRRSAHLCAARNGSKLAFHNALKKYGEGVTWETIAICKTFEIAKQEEIVMIKKLNTFAPNGYNMTMGGDGQKGFTPSVETRKKMSATQKGKKGRIPSDESRKKMSVARKGKKGLTRSPETRKKISEAGKGRVQSNSRKIATINIKTNEIKIFNSIGHAILEGFCRSAIYKCINGIHKQHKGFLWELVK